MLLAVHKSDWHKLTDEQRKRGVLEGEFITLVGVERFMPGTWLKKQLGKVLPSRFQGCEGCNRRASWMDKIYMKWFIVLLLSCLTSFAQLKQTGWTTTTNAADARTALGITGGSQTPWASDIDAAGYHLNDVLAVNIYNGGFSGMQILNDGITSATGDSFLDLAPDASFGLNNGEPAGVGADINLVSANGYVKANGALGFDNTGDAHFHDGVTWFGSGNFIDLGSDSYMLATSAAGGNAGFIANRGDDSGYASFDVITGEDLSTGWSWQLMPSSGSLFLVDRANSLFPISVDVGGSITFETSINSSPIIFLTGGGGLSIDGNAGWTGSDANGTFVGGIKTAP